MTMTVRPAAVAGTWYPASSGALAREVDDYVEGRLTGRAARSGRSSPRTPASCSLVRSAPSRTRRRRGITTMWRCSSDRRISWRSRALRCILRAPSRPRSDRLRSTPRGPPRSARQTSSGHRPRSMRASIRSRCSCRFWAVCSLDCRLSRSSWDSRIAGRSRLLAHALADGLASRRALLIASSDLSHYFDAATAEKLDGEVCDCIAAFSPERLLDLFERYPEGERGRHVGCGIGPAISVMMAARALGAKQARVLRYAHSGEVSGDFDAVVGYLAAVLGSFDAESAHAD